MNILSHFLIAMKTRHIPVVKYYRNKMKRDSGKFEINQLEYQKYLTWILLTL